MISGIESECKDCVSVDGEDVAEVLGFPTLKTHREGITSTGSRRKHTVK